MLRPVVLFLVAAVLFPGAELRVRVSAEPLAGTVDPIPETPPLLPLLPGVVVGGTLAASPDGECRLHRLQYIFTMPDGGVCGPPDFGAAFGASGDGDLKLFVRYGALVDVMDGRIVADYVSEPGGRFQAIDVFVWSSPPARAGAYFIALANCGESPVNYEVSGGTPFIDFAGPSIFRAEIDGDRLLIFGIFFTEGVELFMDGKKQKRVAPADGATNCLVIADRSAKKIAPGQTVRLQLRFPGGFRTAKFKFTRPV